MTLKDKVDRHDEEIASIRKLVLAGRRMLVGLEASQRNTGEQLKSLDNDVQSLVNTLRRGTNGHTKRKLDLQ